MTPERLEEIRKEHERAYKGADVEDLLAHIQSQAEAIRVMREHLKFYANGKHLMSESEAHPGNVCPPIGHYAKIGLAECERILGGGK
jgi:hypothetical protein